MTTPEPCTTSYATRRHYSIDMTESRWRVGRKGTALCKPGGVHINVVDQERLDASLQEWFPGKPRPIIADLPECKMCARTAARLNASEGDRS